MDENKLLKKLNLLQTHARLIIEEVDEIKKQINPTPSKKKKPGLDPAEVARLITKRRSRLSGKK